MNAPLEANDPRRRRSVRIAVAMVVVGVLLAVAFGQYVVYGVIPLVVGGFLMYQHSAKKPLKWWQAVLALLTLFAMTLIVLVVWVLAYRYFRG